MSMPYRVAKAVMRELNGRSGYDNLWDELELQDQLDILEALARVIDEEVY